MIYAIRVLQDETQILGRGLERFVFQPWGAAGGSPGLAARVVLNLGTAQERELGKIDVVRAQAGDLVTIMTPGGGGYGSPFERDMAAVADDVRLGFVTHEGARRDYGVVFRDGTCEVDTVATAELQQRPRNRNGGWGFGSARERWEEVFDDSNMTALAAALLKVPSAMRQGVRQRAYDSVVPGLAKEGAALLLKPEFDVVAARERLRAVTNEILRKWEKP